jgi:hypothetical protein
MLKVALNTITLTLKLAMPTMIQVLTVNNVKSGLKYL